MIDDAIKDRILISHPMLRELPAGTLDTLMSNATFMQVPAGAMIFDENQPCMGFP